MTDRIEDITRAVVYEVYLAMGDDGLNALLTADVPLSITVRGSASTEVIRRASTSIFRE